MKTVHSSKFYHVVILVPIPVVHNFISPQNMKHRKYKIMIDRVWYLMVIKHPYGKHLSVFGNVM